MGRVPARASRSIAGCAAMVLLAGSLTYAAAKVSYTPTNWVATSALTAADLLDVAFDANGAGCAVGVEGAVLLSDDAGVS